MEEDFRSLLLSTTAVTDICGDRINFGSHPQGAAFPSVVLNVVAGAEGITMNGPNGLLEAIVQADCYATTYGEAKLLSRSIIEAANYYREDDIRLIVHTTTRDSREGGSNEAERPYRVSLDFNIAWRAV